MSEWKKVDFNEIYEEPSKNGLIRPKAVRGAGYKMVNMGEIFAHSRICEEIPGLKYQDYILFCQEQFITDVI